MGTYIELPGDKYGNRTQKNSHPRLIEAEYRDGTLYVLTPDFPWKTLEPAWWAEVDRAPGDITKIEWAEIVSSLKNIPEWMIHAARSVLDYQLSILGSWPAL